MRGWSGWEEYGNVAESTEVRVEDDGWGFSVQAGCGEGQIVQVIVRTYSTPPPTLETPLGLSGPDVQSAGRTIEAAVFFHLSFPPFPLLILHW